MEVCIAFSFLILLQKGFCRFTTFVLSIQVQNEELGLRKTDMADFFLYKEESQERVMERHWPETSEHGDRKDIR